MGWFDRQSQPAPAVKESKYTVDKVRERLQTLGLLRLRIVDPELKVFITMITWSALPYLERIGGQNPTGAQISDVMSTLDMLIKALEGYITIQDNPAAYQSQGGAEVLMKSAHDAVFKYLLQLQSTDASSGDLSGYRALTEYLNGLTSLVG